MATQLTGGFNPSQNYDFNSMANANSGGTMGAAQGQGQYDLSGMFQGYNKLQNLNIPQAARYNPFQFSTPNFNTVGPQALTSGLQSAGPYGTTSQQTYNNLYNAAYKAGAQPLQAQSADRMRQLTQGFSGAGGRLGGAAQAQLQLRNAQQTGSDLQGLSSNLSAQQQQEQLGEQQTARAQDYAQQQQINQANYQERLNQAGQTFQEAQNQRNFIANTALQNQQNQANQNYQAAGFNAQQAQQYAMNQGMQAQQLFQMGMQYPQLQAYLTGNERQAWQNSLQQIGSMTGVQV